MTSQVDPPNLNLSTERQLLSLDLSTITDVLKRYFAAQSELRFLTIFGSFADGRSHDKSDVDLAIDLGRPILAEELVTMAQDLGSQLGREVDIVDLYTSHGAVLEEAIVKGYPVIKRSPDDFARLLKKMWYDKADNGRMRELTMTLRRNLWQK